MKILIALIGLTIAAGCASFISVSDKQAQTEQLAWTDMCRLLIAEEVSYKCNRIMPPLVEYEKMRSGLHGYYDGSDTIFISTDLSSTEVIATLFHEMVHYLHVQSNIIPIPGPASQVCWSENEAWTLEGIYSDKDNSKWWRSYPYCWQYYGNTQYTRDLGAVYNEINDLIDEIINTIP